MRVFVTGASGFIGQAVIKELQSHGHQVLGLARSDNSAKVVDEIGAEVLRGDLEDLSTLKKGAEMSDGIIHLAFVHDFDNFARGCEIDRAAIQAIGECTAGTGKPLVIASGTGAVLPASDGISYENSPPKPGHHVSVRHQSAALVESLSKDHGIRGVIVRISPTVHDEGDTMFIPQLISAARKNGKVVYVGDGLNLWPAVHRKDAAVLFRLALENGRAGATYNAVGEQGVRIIEIMTLMAERLELPLQSMSKEDAARYLGFLAGSITLDAPTSSERTQKELGWRIQNIGLLEDMERNYF